MTRYEVAGGATGWVPAGGPSPAGHRRVGAGCERHPPPQPAQHRCHGAAPGGHLGAAAGRGNGRRRAAAGAGGTGRERGLPQRRGSRRPGAQRPATRWSCTPAPIPQLSPSAASPGRARIHACWLTCARPRRMFNQHGKINLIVVSNQGDALGGAAHSQEVTTHLRGLLSDPKVAAQLYAFLARDPAVAQALRRAARGRGGQHPGRPVGAGGGLEAGSLIASHAQPAGRRRSG